MYIPTIVLMVIVLLVIESVFVHKTSIKLDILDKKMKFDILSHIFPNAINQIMKKKTRQKQLCEHITFELPDYF